MLRLHGCALSIVGTSFMFACGAGANIDPEDGIDPSAYALSDDQVYPNETGVSANLSSAGFLDTSNEFFQSLGTNGRACVSCHTPQDGFTITPKSMQALFERCETLIATPAHQSEEDEYACAIFRASDGANSPDADVSTKEARRAAYSLLLNKGLIRIELGVPPNADFDVVAVDDPYGYATTERLSLYRRPLPATNLTFLRSVMWDQRETSQTFVFPPFVVPLSLNEQLMSQADNATLSHADSLGSLTQAQLQSIVDFELGLYSAQVNSREAGSLSAAGAIGGVENLSEQRVPANGENTFGFTAFTPIVFTLFDAWQGDSNPTRASIARGQALFNTRKAPGIPNSPFFDATGTTCSECHTAENLGENSVPIALAQVLVSEPQFRTPDMPLYTLQCSATGVAKGACTAGQQKQSTDPGRALITGSWRSVSAFKVPGLRNLAARAPYFHNGSAATLRDVVDFYVTTLQFQFTEQEKDDLVNFLSAL